MFRILIFHVLFFLFGSSGTLRAEPQDSKVLAVLDLNCDSKIKSQFCRQLGKESRRAVLESVRGTDQDLSVLTRENMLNHLKVMGVDPSCLDSAQCEVDLGRKLGVDFIVTGEVIIFERRHIVNLSLHETLSGKLLGSERLAHRGEKFDLLDKVFSLSKELIRKGLELNKRPARTSGRRNSSEITVESASSIGGSSLSVAGLGMQFVEGTPRFQLSGLSLQLPALRLEGLQYTSGVGVSFLRPGLGFTWQNNVNGGWVSPHYVIDWLNTGSELRQIGGLEFGHGMAEIPWSLKISADFPLSSEPLSDPRIGAQFYISTHNGSEVLTDGLLDLIDGFDFIEGFAQLISIGGQWAGDEFHANFAFLDFNILVFRSRLAEISTDGKWQFLPVGVAIPSAVDSSIIFSPYYMFDWIGKINGRTNHKIGINVGYLVVAGLEYNFGDVPWIGVNLGFGGPLDEF